MNEDIDDNASIIASRKWIEQFVVKHNLCPFAAKPVKEKRIRYVSYAGSREDELAETLVSEIVFLLQTDPLNVETSIVVVPMMFADFLDYNQFLDVVDDIIDQLKVDGVIQVASFHPQYQFADLSVDDVRNYTNRSPYPMFHLIREDSIKVARQKMETETIPERNMGLLLTLGIDSVLDELASLRGKD